MQRTGAGEAGQPRVVAYRSCPVQPWRNGRGFLRSLAEGPGWQLRLAEIARSGPFSDYAGSRRLFAIVQGAVRLRMPSGEVHDCDPDSAIVSFDGGFPPDCEVIGDAPAQALNFIVDPALTDARLDRHVLSSGPLRLSSGPLRLDADPGCLVAIHVQAGRIECGGLRVDRRDTLLMQPPTGAATASSAALSGSRQEPAVVLAAWLMPKAG